MGKLFKDKITKLTELEAAQCLRQAWKDLYGEYPSVDTLAVLWAKTALETGRWKFIHCYNWGNIKRSGDENYCMFRCSEIINGKEKWFDPPHRQTWFRAYETAAEGALDYLKFLSLKKRYEKAWEAVKKGDPILFSHELKKAGYYTASENLYTKGVVSLTNELKNKVKTIPDWKSFDVTVESLPKTESIEAVDVEPTNDKKSNTSDSAQIAQSPIVIEKSWFKKLFELFFLWLK